MDTVQIICTLKNIKSFLGVYSSDLLPHSIQQQTGTVIIDTDPHTKQGSHWLSIHFQPKSSTAFYFDSHGQHLIRPQFTFITKTKLYCLELY